jgi:hypothetical protein
MVNGTIWSLCGMVFGVAAWRVYVLSNPDITQCHKSIAVLGYQGRRGTLPTKRSVFKLAQLTH